MANRASVMSGIWQNIKKTIQIARAKELFVGADQFGNKYYERQPDPSRGVKQLRRVDGPTKDEFTPPNVPAEWMTWLQGRRRDPPSESELEKNFAYMVRTQHRAKELEHERQLSSEDSEKPMKSASAKREFPKYDDYEVKAGEFTDRWKSDKPK